MIDRAKILAKKYFDDKGYKNAEINITQRDDAANKNMVILDFEVDKKEKMKVHEIIIEGNSELTDKKLKGGLFRKGALSKTHEAGKLSTFLKSKKFTPDRWKEDKQKLIDKYNEYTGENAKPFTMGGGTYARHFPNAVSFGVETESLKEPEWVGSIHGPEEAGNVDWFLKALEMYISAIIELDAVL